MKVESHRDRQGKSVWETLHLLHARTCPSPPIPATRHVVLTALCQVHTKQQASYCVNLQFQGQTSTSPLFPQQWVVCGTGVLSASPRHLQMRNLQALAPERTWLTICHPVCQGVHVAALVYLIREWGPQCYSNALLPWLQQLFFKKFLKCGR